MLSVTPCDPVLCAPGSSYSAHIINICKQLSLAHVIMKLKSDIPRYGTGNEDTNTTEPGVRLIFLNFPNCDCNAMLDQDKHIELPPILAPTPMFTYECTRDFSSVINVKIVIFIHRTKFQF